MVGEEKQCTRNEVCRNSGRVQSYESEEKQCTKNEVCRNSGRVQSYDE